MPQAGAELRGAFGAEFADAAAGSGSMDRLPMPAGPAARAWLRAGRCLVDLDVTEGIPSLRPDHEAGPYSPSVRSAVPPGRGSRSGRPATWAIRMASVSPAVCRNPVPS